MPYYAWEGIDFWGTVHVGTCQARSPQELEHALLSKELGLVRAVQETPKTFLKPITGAIKYDFYKQLSLLLSSGFSLDKALTLIAEQANHPSFKAIMWDVVADVQEGYSLAHGLSHYGQYFNPLTQQVIASTQDARSLCQALDYLADYEETMNQFVKKMRSALMMPCITFLFFLVIAGVIIIGIVPRFAQLFSSFNREVPWVTSTLLYLGSLFSTYGLYALVAVGIALLGGLRLVKKNNRARKMLRGMAYRVPLVGSLVRDMHLTFYFKSLALLVHNGGNVRKALTYAADGLRDSELQEKFADIMNMVDQGEPLHKAFAPYSDFFSRDIIALLAVGQESGTMFFVFSRICDIYRARVENYLAFLTHSAQPIMMIILGCLIMGLIVAVYVPIFTMSSIL